MSCKNSILRAVICKTKNYNCGDHSWGVKTSEACAYMGDRAPSGEECKYTRFACYL